MTKIHTALALMAAFSAGDALAQQSQPQPEKPQEREQAPKEPPKPGQPAAQPTLDELLGLAPEGKPADPKTTAPEDPAKAELEQKLSGAEISQAFLQAVALMEQTAERIATSRDTGLTTQRMQEDVIRKLDVLISQAQKQQQQSRSRSRQQNQDPQQQPDQQQQQSQSQQQQQQGAGDPQQAQTPPGGREGQLGPAMAQGAAWGALPERMRDALLQGNADKFSSIWGPLTEAYYRKLAEEAGR